MTRLDNPQMQSQNPSPSVRHLGNQKTMRLSLALCIAALMYLVWWRAILYPHQQAQLRLYQHSPGCTANAPISSNFSPCTVIKERIVQKYYSTSKNSRYYFLYLQTGDATPQRVELYGSRLWDNVYKGDYVSAKYWKGDIVSVSNNGSENITYESPEHSKWTSYTDAIFAAFLAVIFGLYFALGLIANRAEAKKTAPASPAFITPTKDYW